MSERIRLVTLKNPETPHWSSVDSGRDVDQVSTSRTTIYIIRYIGEIAKTCEILRNIHKLLSHVEAIRHEESAGASYTIDQQDY